MPPDKPRSSAPRVRGFGIGAVVAVSDLFAEAEAFNRDVRW